MTWTRRGDPAHSSERHAASRRSFLLGVGAVTAGTVTAGLGIAGCERGTGRTGATATKNTAPPIGPPANRAGPLKAPIIAGRAGLAESLPATARPTKAPGQAAPSLAGRPLPTNQWWTSALIGPLTQPLWALPYAVQARADGLALSAANPTATADHVVTPFLPDLVAGGPVSSLQVTGFGHFDVRFDAIQRRGGLIRMTLAQGSPVLYFEFVNSPPNLQVPAGAAVSVPATGPAVIAVGGRTWLAFGSTAWQEQGSALSLSASGGLVSLTRVPDGVSTASWHDVVVAVGLDPIIDTRSSLAWDASSQKAQQRLLARRASGRTGPMMLLPHHARHQSTVAASVTGSMATPRGTAGFVSTADFSIEVPTNDACSPLPTVRLSAGARGAVLQDLAADLAQAAAGGGSYFGAKELGRLASIAEIARVTGATSTQAHTLSTLRTQLTEVLGYSGSSDAHYFGYDSTWGGLIGYPAEFGAQDYNDHHLQNGYLVRAAAVLGASDPSFVRDYGSLVDAIVADYAGSETMTGVPSLRAFQPYLGHSAASGYALFADGNNQESSSESLQAWAAMAQWGAVRGDTQLRDTGRAHYGIEAESARLYWLGEDLSLRPSGYAHSVAGIVWDAKIDFATWFSADPEAIMGIQLLPANETALYRNNPAAAARRAQELQRLVGGPARIWGDLFALDLAVNDPAAARKRLDQGVPREPSTSRAMVRYLVELLAARR